MTLRHGLISLVMTHLSLLTDCNQTNEITLPPGAAVRKPNLPPTAATTADADLPSGGHGGVGAPASQRGVPTPGGAHPNRCLLSAELSEPQSRAARAAATLSARGGNQGGAQGGGGAVAVAQPRSRGLHPQPPVRVQHVAAEPRDHRGGHSAPRGRSPVRGRTPDAGGTAGVDEEREDEHPDGVQRGDGV